MLDTTLILAITGIIVTGAAGIIGFLIGKRESKKQLELFLKALNIERIIHARNSTQQMHNLFCFLTLCYDCVVAKGCKPMSGSQY